MNSEHPTPDILRRLVEGRLDGPEFSTVEQHVESCASVCQPLLDQLAKESRAVTTTLANDEPPPTIPGYADFVEVGRGGMGVVYQALHIALNRPVAVKVLKAGLPPEKSAALATRFGKEAQITGQLQHPGVPPVHDLGATEDGRPYMVMRLIRGQTLAERFREGRAKGEPTGVLIGLFEKVFDAVAYAHSRGIVHRDLKPQNVMVGAFGAVSVLDWGLAKRLESGEPDPGAEDDRECESRTNVETAPEFDSHTQAGALLGSLPYMSPEQAGGEMDLVDQRSDVFGLGAILCCLLTGQPPYVSGQGDKALRLMAVRWETGEAMAKLDASGADPEVVALAKRCLAKNPADRPKDAQAVADALAALRSDADARVRRAEIGKARADTRRRVITWASGVVAAVLFVGIAGTTLGLFEARRQKAEAELQESRAKEEARLKEIARASEQERADGEKRAKIEAEAKRKEAEANLAFARRGYKLIGGFFEHLRPESRPYSVAELLEGLRNSLDSTTMELDRYSGVHPLDVAQARQSLGHLVNGLGDVRRATDLFQQVYDTRLSLLGPSDDETLAAASNLGVARWEIGEHEKAAKLLGDTLSKLEAAATPDARVLVTVSNNLALALAADGKIDNAILLLERMYPFARAKLQLGDIDTVRCAGNLASLYVSTKQARKAIETIEPHVEALRIDSLPHQHQLFIVENNLAMAYQQVGNLRHAITLLESARMRMIDRLGPGHPYVLTASNNIACVYRDQRQLAKAIQLFKDTLEKTEIVRGRSHFESFSCAGNLAIAYQIDGQYESARLLHESVFDRMNSTLHPIHPMTVQCLLHLMDVYNEAGLTDRAVRTLQPYLLKVRQVLGKDDPRLHSIMSIASHCLLLTGSYRHVEPLLRESLAWHKKQRPDDWGTYHVMSMLGGSLLGQGKLLDAEPYLVAGFTGMSTREKTISPQGLLRNPEALDRLIALYIAMKKPDEVKKYRELRAKYPPEVAPRPQAVR